MKSFVFDEDMFRSLDDDARLAILDGLMKKGRAEDFNAFFDVHTEKKVSARDLLVLSGIFGVGEEGRERFVPALRRFASSFKSSFSDFSVQSLVPALLNVASTGAKEIFAEALEIVCANGDMKCDLIFKRMLGMRPDLDGISVGKDSGFGSFPLSFLEMMSCLEDQSYFAACFSAGISPRQAKPETDRNAYGSMEVAVCVASSGYRWENIGRLMEIFPEDMCSPCLIPEAKEGERVIDRMLSENREFVMSWFSEHQDKLMLLDGPTRAILEKGLLSKGGVAAPAGKITL